MEHFISPLTLAALVPIITEYLKQCLNWKALPAFTLFKRKIYIAQLVSLSVSLILAAIAYYFKLGFFAELSLPWSIIWGFFIGLASNGAFDAGYLDFLHTLFKKLKTKKR